MRSRAALNALLRRSDPIVKDARYTAFGYWRVTFSVVAGLDMSVMVCNAYVDRDMAVDQALITLRNITGQIVTEEA